MNHRPIAPDAYVRHAGPEIDHHRPTLFSLISQHRQTRGVAGEGAPLHPDLLVGHTLHAGLEPGAFTGDKVIMGLDLFGVDPERIHRGDAAVQGIATEQFMEDGVIPRQRQMGGQLVELLQRALRDAVLVVSRGRDADGLVAGGQMGSAHRQINLGDFRLGAALAIRQSHPGGRAGVAEVGHLSLPHAGGDGFAHAEEGEGAVAGHFRHGHGHFLGAEVGGDDDFVLGSASHDHGGFLR